MRVSGVCSPTQEVMGKTRRGRVFAVRNVQILLATGIVKVAMHALEKVALLWACKC